MRALILTALVVLPTTAAAGTNGGLYVGQEPPGLEPEIFAPGVVSTGLHERDIVIHPDGRTVWYGVIAGPLFTVLETRLVDGRWTEPAQAAFHVDRAHACFEPALAPDGRRVVFLTNRAAPGQEQGPGWANQNLFTAERLPGGGWSEPVAMPAPITSDDGEFFPSFAADGTLYFTREDATGSAVWCAEPDGDGWSEPVRIEGGVNITDRVYNTWCAPDESFLVGCVAGHPDNIGPADYWISFRTDDGAWGDAVNLGEPFNGPGLNAMSASLSPDGRCFFFSSRRVTAPQPADDEPLRQSHLLSAHGEPGGGSLDIWWVDAAVLERWRD